MGSDPRRSRPDRRQPPPRGSADLAPPVVSDRARTNMRVAPEHVDYREWPAESRAVARHAPLAQRCATRHDRAMRIVVVGAGIGGLSAAIGLRRAGHDVSVLERAPQPRGIGAGLVLFQNAMRALDRLGIARSGRRARHVRPARSRPYVRRARADHVAGDRAEAELTGLATLAVVVLVYAAMSGTGRGDELVEAAATSA
jgi:NAD(P)-binding Rossmann-like domain